MELQIDEGMEEVFDFMLRYTHPKVFEHLENQPPFLKRNINNSMMAGPRANPKIKINMWHDASARYDSQT